MRANTAAVEVLARPAYVVLHRGDELVDRVEPLHAADPPHERHFDLGVVQLEVVAVEDGPEPQVDAAIARQRTRDPDLWVLEIESRDGRTLLDQDGLF